MGTSFMQLFKSDKRQMTADEIRAKLVRPMGSPKELKETLQQE